MPYNHPEYPRNTLGNHPNTKQCPNNYTEYTRNNLTTTQTPSNTIETTQNTLETPWQLYKHLAMP